MRWIRVVNPRHRLDNNDIDMLTRIPCDYDAWAVSDDDYIMLVMRYGNDIIKDAPFNTLRYKAPT